MSYVVYELDLTSNVCGGNIGRFAQVVDELGPKEAVRVRVSSDKKDIVVNFAKIRGLKVEEVRNEGGIHELIVVKG